MDMIIEHYRYNCKDNLKRYRRGRTSWQPAPKGGETIVRLYHNGKPYIGFAACNKSDNFCYKTGRLVAMWRAIEQLPFYVMNNCFPDWQILQVYVNSTVMGNRYSQELSQMYMENLKMQFQEVMQ